MNRQKDTKPRVFAQKLMDDYLKRRRDSQEDWLIEHDEFLKYPNKELFKYVETDYAELIQILEGLKSRGVIFQYECLDTEEMVKNSKKDGLESYRTTGFSVDRMPQYEECVIRVPDDFFEQAEIYLAGKSDVNASAPTTNSSILYIDSSGNFWHGDKQKHCYPMGQKSARFFILNYLVDNKDYQETASITSALNRAFSDSKTSQNVRAEIGKIRTNITKYLGLNDVIESKDGSGYRINPNYQVTPEKR